mgnify:CR=1 FL=1
MDDGGEWKIRRLLGEIRGIKVTAMAAGRYVSLQRSLVPRRSRMDLINSASSLRSLSGDSVEAEGKHNRVEQFLRRFDGLLFSLPPWLPRWRVLIL